MEYFLLHYLAWWSPLIYLVAFVGMIVEGDIFLFTLAFLTHQGWAAWPIMLITVFVGSALGDILWYLLGEKMNSYPWRIIRWLERLAEPLDRQIVRNPGRAIFLTKFTYGLHHALLLRVGALKIPLRRFILIDLISLAAWILVIGGVGFIFSYSFLAARHYLRFAEWALLLGIIAVVLLERLIGWVSRRRLQEPNGAVDMGH